MKRKYPKLKIPPEEEDTASLKKQLRNTHSVNAGLEDTISLLWAILDEATRAILRMRSIAKRAINILKVMRSGPHAYDSKNLRNAEKKDRNKR